ncbi:hypothetical protein EOD42_16840 [Rhodovarius crocodyli]|uniref:Phage tail protein n=1 Tax=Rhodovarius crocodyli TaxID=1979269 RepID=A0A437MC83_9PROT|nr:hypothetical protein [Rhodovarius crocodyli]RVT95251.1 hypothetical protein EOD42_16840 [Rhodovarius crocodyli]
MATITSANSELLLAVNGLFTVPQAIQGYSTDEAFTTDAAEPAEVMMGVDGKMSAGWVPTVTVQSITLQADSTSNAFFDQWDAAEKAAREVYFAQGILRLPSVGVSYALLNGVLTSIPRMLSARKVLQPRQFRITWESVTVAPV